MDNQNEFLALMEKVRAGSEEAAAELFRRYHSHILQGVQSLSCARSLSFLGIPGENGL
jgi:hypothetical protein